MHKTWTSRAASAALIAGALLAGCGGGGGRAGECIFAAACNQGPGSGGLPGTPAPVNYFQQGTGATVLPLPSAATAVRIKAKTARPSSLFTVYVGNSLLINEIVGSGNVPPTQDGVYIVPPGGTLQIRDAEAVDWEVSAVAVEAPTNPAANFSKAGTGDSVFLLPSRPAKYRVQATFPGTSSNFIVRVGGNLVVNTIIGTALTPTAFDGTYALVANGASQVEITGSNGVNWSFVEVP